MITRQKSFMQAVGIVLSLMLFPSTAYVQEQKELPMPQQGETVSEPTQQQPTQLIIPQQETATESENQKPETATPVNSAKTLANNESSYTIKKGDTLWDISNTFFKDPFLWPFIWKANRSITNPDLIYPGNMLTIPNLAPIERALSAPAVESKEQAVEKKVQEEPAEDREAPRIAKPLPSTPVETPSMRSKLILPEEQPIPIIDKYSMLRAGYINETETGDKIIGSPQADRSIYGFDNTVYVKIRDTQKVNIGDKFLIYTPLETVKHPKTGKRIGRLIRGLGILQITAKDSPDAITARITLSFDTIENGNLLVPYEEPMLVYNSKEKKSKNISGYIVAAADGREINAQLDFVYLDKGNKDGVEPGDRFIVYLEPEGDSSFPRKVAGEVQVFIVKEHASTAVVKKSTDVLEKGNTVEFKK